MQTGHNKLLQLRLKTQTNNLSRAHVTRNRSGPDTWAIVYSMQLNNNAF